LEFMARHYWEAFEEKTITYNLNSSAKKDIIEELVDSLIQAKKVKKADKGKLLKLFAERENRGSTGIGLGVAIPHVQFQGVDSLVGAMGIHQGGVDFKAIDGDPVHIVFLSVRPEGEAEDHVGFLKWMSRLARHEDFRRFARNAKSQKELFALLKEMTSL